MDKQAKENWAVAGLIAGEAFADEFKKMAGVFLLERYVADNGFTKDAAGLARRAFKAVTTSPALRRIGIPAAALAAGGGAGAIVGMKKERQEAMEEINTIAPKIFRHGFVQGARQGFARGARAGFLHARGERSTG